MGTPIRPGTRVGFVAEVDVSSGEGSGRFTVREVELSWLVRRLSGMDTVGMNRRLGIVVGGVIVAVLASGCGSRSRVAVVSGVTPSPSVSATPSPGVTPSPSVRPRPSPTPTLASHRPVVSPTPSPSHGPKTYTVTETDAGKTVRVARGEFVVLVLHNTYWTIQGSSDPKVLKAVTQPSDGSASTPCPAYPGSGCGTVSQKFAALGTRER